MVKKDNDLYLKVPQGVKCYYSSFELIDMMKSIINSIDSNDPFSMSIEDSLVSLEYKIEALRQDGTLNDLLDRIESLIEQRSSNEINDTVFVDRSSRIVEEMLNR